MTSIEASRAAEPPQASDVFGGFCATLPNASQTIRVATAIVERSRILADEIERQNSGDSHGRFKLGHAARITHELPALKVRYPDILTDDEIVSAYALASLGHDAGSLALRAEQLRSGGGHRGAVQLHGARTVAELNECLYGVEARPRLLAKVVMRWHDSLETPTPGEIRSEFPAEIAALRTPTQVVDQAYGLLRLFRDRDKVNILSEGPRYFTPDFMLGELVKWQIGGDNRRNCPWVDSNGRAKSGLLRYHGFPATGEEHGNPPISPERLKNELEHAKLYLPLICHLPGGEQLERAERLHQLDTNKFITVDVLRTAIFGPRGRQAMNPLTVQGMVEHQLGVKAQVSYDYASYVGYALQFIYGLELAGSVQEVRERDLHGVWLEFLKHNTSLTTFAAVSKAVEEYISHTPDGRKA